MKLDFRDVVFSAAYDVMAGDAKVVMLTNDMGAMGLDKIAKDFPDRTVNVGISEQNMISVAGGLALTGRKVFVYGIIAHVYARAFEQLRNDVCTLNLPVIILGVGSGLSYGSDGPTHHGVQDIAVLRALPNMAIYNPADGVAAAALVKLAAARGQPAHVRMDKEQLEPIYTAGEERFEAGFSVLNPGQDIVVVSTGVLVHRALEAARRLAAEGLSVRVIDLYRLKPVDDDLLGSALSGTASVVTFEENTRVGALGSIVAEAMARCAVHARLRSFDLRDDVMMGAASRGWAERTYGLGLESLMDALREGTKATSSAVR